MSMTDGTGGKARWCTPHAKFWLLPQCGALALWTIVLLLGCQAAVADELSIAFDGDPRVDFEAALFHGTWSGSVGEESDPRFAGSEVVCEFEGGGDTLQGRCLFSTPERDTAVAEWRCRTVAARCRGVASWLGGTGRLAGLAGEAEIDTPSPLQTDERNAIWRGRWAAPSLTQRWLMPRATSAARTNAVSISWVGVATPASLPAAAMAPLMASISPGRPASMSCHMDGLPPRILAPKACT
jgi:hypothetical protein